MDQALTPVGDDDETLDLLTKTSGATGQPSRTSERSLS